MLTIEYARGGLFLPGPGLWLDPCGRRAGGVVVSHAHSDHIGAHDEFMATETTAALLLARLGGKRSPVILPFGEARECGGGDAAYRLTLLPAGHILGSAMALIEAGGSSLLYTGDFKLRPGLCAEPCAPRRADVLVMETTFGRPAYRFPPASVVMGEIVRFCRETVESGATPVLLAYSLGKSQELLRGLAGGGLPVMLQIGRASCRERVYSSV